MGVKIRVKNHRLYLDVIQNRKHHWESLRITLSTDNNTRKEQMKLAEIARARREMQLMAGEWNITDFVAGKKLLTTYLQQQKEKATSKGSSRILNALILKLKNFKRGDVQLSAINVSWIQDFQTWLVKENKLKMSTINLYMAILHTALNNAERENIISKNPASQVRNVKVEKSDKPTLTVDELKHFASVEIKSPLKKECQKAFLFACYTGLRISDLSTLKWQEIEERTDRNSSTVIHWIKKRQVKTKAIVEIPLNEAAWELIKPYNVFPMKESKVFPLLKNTGTNLIAVKEIGKAAGIEKHIGWHTARRTFATLGLENGIDPFTLQRLMGHSKVTMTALYAKSDNIKAAAVSKFENVLSEKENQIKEN